MERRRPQALRRIPFVWRRRSRRCGALLACEGDDLKPYEALLPSDGTDFDVQKPSFHGKEAIPRVGRAPPRRARAALSSRDESKRRRVRNQRVYCHRLATRTRDFSLTGGACRMERLPCVWTTFSHWVEMPSEVISMIVAVGLALLLAPVFGGTQVGPISVPKLPRGFAYASLFLGFVLVAGPFSPIPNCPSCPILFNSDFEQIDTIGEVLADWYPLHSTGTISIDRSVVHSGRAAVKVSVPMGSPAVSGLGQLVGVPKNTKMSLSGWIRSEGVRIGNGALVKEGALIKVEGQRQGASYLWSSAGRPGAYDWTRFRFSFDTGTNDLIRVSVQVGDNAGDAEGTAWFDELKLACVK